MFKISDSRRLQLHIATATIQTALLLDCRSTHCYRLVLGRLGGSADLTAGVLTTDQRNLKFWFAADPVTLNKESMLDMP